VAGAFLVDGKTLAVANRGGSVALVDVTAGRVRGEFPAGQRLTGLAVLPGGKQILVTDSKRHELVALAFDGKKLIPRSRLAVGPYPASVAVLPGGKRATVACLWSRRVEVIHLAPLASRRVPGTWRPSRVVRLPFAPREQCALPGGSQVVVADAFGGHLAVINAAAGRLVAVHRLTGHNLRGLAVSADGKNLLVAHQILNQKAPTTRKNIRRGVLMANVLRSIPVDRLRNPRANLDRAGRLIRLGQVGAGAGDPAGVAVLGAGKVAVALAGVNEVALVRLDTGKTLRRHRVGRRPTVVRGGTKGQPLVVLNTLDDSVSVLDSRRGGVRHTISLGPQPALGDRDHGELLFYDARLSRDGWLSCHSCHTDGHSNGLLADTHGDNTFGTPKRVLTLLNTRMTDPWGWNGQFKNLHDQVRASLAGTLASPAVTWRRIDDLVSFLASLPPPPPPEPPAKGKADREQIARGRRVFEKHHCGQCHVAPLTYTSWDVYDVGFADERGLRKFNPPSLRGVGHGDRFLHDNRAATLKEVFTKYRHRVPADMPAEDLADLLRFLRSL
jgi:DNA-binding beta-propeller fold protein YncE/cytochrome c peroxidase